MRWGIQYPIVPAPQNKVWDSGTLGHWGTGALGIWEDL